MRGTNASIVAAAVVLLGWVVVGVPASAAPGAGGCPAAYDVAPGSNAAFHPGGEAGAYITLGGAGTWTVAVTSPRVLQPNGQLRATTFIGEVKSDAPFTFVAVNLEPSHGSDVIKQSGDGTTIDFWFTNYSGLDSFTVSDNCASTYMTFDKLSVNGPSHPTPGSRIAVGSVPAHPFGAGGGKLRSDAVTRSPTPGHSHSPSASPSASPSHSHSPSGSPSPSPSHTPSGTATPSRTPTGSPSPSRSHSPSVDPTQSLAPSPSPSASVLGFRLARTGSSGTIPILVLGLTLIVAGVAVVCAAPSEGRRH